MGAITTLSKLGLRRTFSLSDQYSQRTGHLRGYHLREAHLLQSAAHLPPDRNPVHEDNWRMIASQMD